MVEHLSNTGEALESIPGTEKTNSETEDTPKTENILKEKRQKGKEIELRSAGQERYLGLWALGSHSRFMRGDPRS